MKVIIAGGGTGGHLFPAVALGEEMRRQRPGTQLLFVGSSSGIEAKWLPRSGFDFELYDVHGLRGHGLAQRTRAIIEFVRAFVRARATLARLGPDLVVSAGGYASMPIAAAAILKRIRLVIMEQNVTPGLVNILLGRFADRVCVGFDETARHFRLAKVETTGIPIRFRPQQHPEQAVDNVMQILVLGGSSGAHRLNIGVLSAFKIWGKDVIKLKVEHQTGEVDEGLVRSGYQELGLDAHVTPFIDDVAGALTRADLIVARAGANTVAEIALTGRPAIYVPYPFHRDHQQEHNARVMEHFGGGLIVPDDDHLADGLAAAFRNLACDRDLLNQMGERAKAAARPDAAARVAQICFEVATAN